MPSGIVVEQHSNAEMLLQVDEAPEADPCHSVMPEQPQNWCDLFFVLDILGNNTDDCEVLVFTCQLDDHVRQLESKTVDPELSYYDTRKGRARCDEGFFL